MTKNLAGSLLAATAALLIPTAVRAAGGDPITTAAQSGLDLAIGIGPIACALGIVGTCAGGLMKNGAVMAGGATTAICGGAWAGAPQVVEQVIGGAAGFALGDLLTSPPALSIISQLVG